MASPHRFVFASDAFKGTLSSAQTAALLEDAACARFPECDCVGVPMADGGTGTVDVLIAACGLYMRVGTVITEMLSEFNILTVIRQHMLK